MKLKRELGAVHVFAIASGAMISSGLFILPALAYAKAGPAAIFSYALAGILVFPSMLAKAELATAMPKAGGIYFFIERSMGTAVGTVGGFTSWFSLSFKSAFALVGMGVFARLVAPGITDIQVRLFAVGFCLVFMLINIIGVKHPGRLQVALVLSLMGILGLYVLRGFALIQPQRYVPFMPNGFGSVFATAGLVFVSFGGLTKICCVAEEIDNPGRNIPLGMFFAYLVVMVLYVMVVFTTVGLLDSAKLSGSLTPISLGASTFMGNAGSAVLAIAALLAFITTANAGIMTASRDFMAMSRDQILPAFFQRMNARYRTPHFSIVLTAVFMIAVILFLSLENLVKTASTLKILLFLLVNLSLIVMRESKIQSYRPKFKAPFYPWIQIAGIIVYGFLIFKMGTVPVAIAGLFVVGTIVWYLTYARSRAIRKAALIHVIERLTSRELVDTTLPDELKDIIIERDDIVEDRFDHLIKECPILDVEGPCKLEDFLEIVSKELSKRLGIDADRIHDMLHAREKESSTVISEGIAIPHIIVEGEKKFSVVVARSREGIDFYDEAPKVHTIFVLAGTRDERNFHLRVLAAIAQIVCYPRFNERWKQARSKDELRHLILLGDRTRHSPPFP